jgi:hypothetical protein
VRWAGVLAIHNFVKVLWILDVGWFQIEKIYNLKNALALT